MYKYTDNTQSNFLSFNQPIGLHMNPENRWVKMADAIPWEIFEKKYSTKPGNSGLGLWEVRQILKKNNNLNLFTTKSNKLFKQQLEIYS